nr:MAG TPA: zinc-ribbon domain protein [Caudoviricetes sp.]
MRRLFDCPYCGGCPVPKRVGDNKECIVYICEDCGRTPVPICAARSTMSGAANVWGAAVGEYLKGKGK